ncbi:MAG: RNA-binding domain-containing protein [Bacteroidota bacterium]
MERTIEMLKEHEVFADLDQEELNRLQDITTYSTYEEGALVFDTSQAPNHLYLIVEGSFILQLPNNEYKTLTEGQIFGEIGVINKDFRSGSIRAAEASSVVKICGQRMFEAPATAPETSLKILSALARRITNYLRTKEQISTREIISQGESDQVEFKSTLRWNLRADKKDRAIENASLKTMVAFMNSKGGILIVGVADDGSLLGLDNDRFSNHDKLLLHLTSLVKDRIGSTYNPFLKYSIEKIEDQFVLRIDCQPSTKPAYLLDAKQDHFYIRTGPSTTDLRLSKVYPYIRERFFAQSEL